MLETPTAKSATGKLEAKLFDSLPRFMWHYREHMVPNHLDQFCELCQHVMRVRGGQ